MSRPRRFVDFRLPFFGMPLAGRFRLLRILLVLRHVGARAVFAHAKAAVPAGPGGACPVTRRNPPSRPSRIPAGIDVPAEQVGDFVHLRASRRCRWRQWSGASGLRRAATMFQILQLAVRVGAARSRFR